MVILRNVYYVGTLIRAFLLANVTVFPNLLSRGKEMQSEILDMYFTLGLTHVDTVPAGTSVMQVL